MRKVPMSQEELLEKLQKYSTKRIHLVLKNNRSTYLSLRRKFGSLTLSLHQGFLYAPEDVCRAIIGYTLKDDRVSGRKLKLFSHHMFDRIERIQGRSHYIDKTKLQEKGRYFDLRVLYDEINQKYFGGVLDLSITWFEKPKYRVYRSITYGTYDPSLKLIRLNKILDRSNVPKYYVSFVIYHEMLHEVCPAYIDKLGRRIVHTPLFRQKEKQFIQYEKAIQWEKRHGRS